MEPQLTNEDISRICMYMRTVDYIKRYGWILEVDTKLKQDFEIICQKIGEIFETLTEDQRDMLLEMHKVQLQSREEKDAKKNARRQRRRA